MEFLVKIDTFKSRSCTYWLKCELTYIAMSSGRTHLNYSARVKMVNAFECCWFSSIFSDFSLSLPCLGKLYVFFLRFILFLLLRFSSLLLEEVEVELLFDFLRFILETFLHLLFWCISLLYLITVVWFSFIISVNFFSFAGLAPSSANGENQKKTEGPRN